MSIRMLPAILSAAAVLTFAACGGDETAATTEPAAPPPPTVTETVVETESETVTQTEPAETEAETEGETATETATESETVTETEESPDLEAVVIRVQGGEARGEPKTITVKQGDRVRIRVTVDEPQDIHIHGYELEEAAAPGRPAVFAFRADLEGIFDIETHLTDAHIGKLVVEP